MPSKTAVIIPAAGNGTRMQLDHPKQFHLLAGEPILVHTVRAFLDSSHITTIIVVVPDGYQLSTHKLLVDHGLNHSSISVIIGGKRRQDSVFEGLKTLDDTYDIVMVHDGARPLVTEELIINCYKMATLHGAAIAALPVKDTLKKGTAFRTISATIDRELLWQAQTPQAARLQLLRNAYAQAGNHNVTDEASLLEMTNTPVHLVEGSETNIKITRPEDLIIAEKLCMKMEKQPRIGHGFDAHKLVPERKLILGGITVPHDKGLAGHSDADVLTHALCDAILGALGAGDIGSHFPDTEEQFKDIYSISLLEKVIDLAAKQNFVISNADITLVCQSPKLASYLPKMKNTLARSCKTENDRINIKATTTEKMGYTGRMEGISCHAVVLLT